jgi:heme A synthase
MAYVTLHMLCMFAFSIVAGLGMFLVWSEWDKEDITTSRQVVACFTVTLLVVGGFWNIALI